MTMKGSTKMTLQKNTLTELSDRIERKYSHVADLAALREQARTRVSSMLSTLQTAREHASLTQSAVAKRLGVTQPTISRWESGDEEISLRDFVFFMQACNEKMALVAAPASARFSDEEIARKIVAKLIEQLYPELDLAVVLPDASAQTKRSNSKDSEYAPAQAPVKEYTRKGLLAKRSAQSQLKMDSAIRQANAAAKAATSSINNLGVALEAFSESNI